MNSRSMWNSPLICSMPLIRWTYGSSNMEGTIMGGASSLSSSVDVEGRAAPCCVGNSSTGGCCIGNSTPGGCCDGGISTMGCAAPARYNLLLHRPEWPGIPPPPVAEGWGGGTWWSRCGCGGSKCIGAKSKEKKSKDSEHIRKRTETKTKKRKSCKHQGFTFLAK
jgi:hypothetical protein